MAHYVQNGFTTKSAITREQFYITHGFKSYVQILDEFKNEIAASTKTSLSSIRPGDQLSAYEICSISGSYDLERGMTINNQNKSHPYAILKSEIGGVYDDNQQIDQRYFHYSLEVEKATNFSNATFSKRGNYVLYKDFLRQDIDSQFGQMPAYLFVRKSSRKPYIFQGVYFVNSLINGNKSFELINSSFVEAPHQVDSANRELLKKFHDERVEFFKNLYSKGADEVIGERRLTEVDGPISDGGISDRTRTIYTSSDVYGAIHDYLSDQILAQKIGDIGERLAYEYETERVKRFAPQQVKNIKKVNDSDGYDFESFDIQGRNIHKVQIEVKSTTNRTPYNPFFMSENEYETMVKNESTYWLYRLYDINGDKPLFYAIRENVKEKISMTPANYKCSFIQ